MSGPVSNPPGALGSALFESMLWKEPEPKPVTEEQRAATEERLRNLSAMGEALCAPFDVDAEMAKRGLKTTAQIEGERTKAERDAALDKADEDDKATYAREMREQEAAKVDAELAAGMDRSFRKIAKTVRKALK